MDGRVKEAIMEAVRLTRAVYPRYSEDDIGRMFHEWTDIRTEQQMDEYAGKAYKKGGLDGVKLFFLNFCIEAAEVQSRYGYIPFIGTPEGAEIHKLTESVAKRVAEDALLQYKSGQQLRGTVGTFFKGLIHGPKDRAKYSGGAGAPAFTVTPEAPRLVQASEPMRGSVVGIDPIYKAVADASTVDELFAIRKPIETDFVAGRITLDQWTEFSKFYDERLAQLR